jgi:hypothetical protein
LLWNKLAASCRSPTTNIRSIVRKWETLEIRRHANLMLLHRACREDDSAKKKVRELTTEVDVWFKQDTLRGLFDMFL